MKNINKQQYVLQLLKNKTMSKEEIAHSICDYFNSIMEDKILGVYSIPIDHHFHTNGYYFCSEKDFFNRMKVYDSEQT